MLQPKLTLDEQFEELAALVDQAFVKTSKFVKGPFTSSDYVTWKLNHIFTPAGWSFTILDGPAVINLSPQSAYVRTVGRLSVRFADGTEVHKDEAGIAPMYGTKESGGGRLDLDNTAPEVHETASKASISDCLKACAERLGQCFRPLIDQELEYHIRAVLPLTGRESHTSIEEALAELFDVTWTPNENGNSKPAGTPAPETAAVGTANSQRPYAAEKVREKARMMANNGNQATATEAQRALARNKLAECFAGDPDADKKRHTVLSYLFGIESTTDPKLTRGHIDALVKWLLLDGKKDSSGDYPLHPNAPAEAAAIIRQTKVDNGQAELPL